MLIGSHNIYTGSLFIDRMRYEKRRADRTKAPLSIVVFDFCRNEGSGVDLAALKAVVGKLRDTDIVGYLSEDKIAILLPDTTEAGADKVMKNIASEDAWIFNKCVVSTYPDQIYNSISSINQEAEGQDAWEQECFDVLFIEDTMELRWASLLVKRAIDILGSVIAILLFSPLMLITAIMIKIDSPGPIIFKQIRLGKKGMPFLFYKFRSMQYKADDRIHRDFVASLISGDTDAVNQGDADKPLYKIKSDPRVTKVGKFIRKTSIDELPQLFNVLKGDMSLVGPRPPLPYEVEKYQLWHLRRVTDMRPGITGLWQVEGRSKTTFDEMVRLDIQYIREWSPSLDVKILLKTVKVTLLRIGAV